MTQNTRTEPTLREKILTLDESDIASFIRGCVKERSLSKVIGLLNNNMLSGTASERQEAEEALHRLGFL